MGKLGIVPVYGDGENLLSWLHVHDAASAIVATATGSPGSGAIYTVSDGGFYTWNQLVQAFGRAWGRMPRIIHGPPVLFRLAGSAGRIRVAALAAEIGWSRKHLAERFAIEIGAGPKTAGRILRFARARRAIDRHARAGDQLDWAGLAADWGYADQAHLIREFRAMAGATPADYLRDVVGRFRALSAEAR